jgi:hypothetical protein
VVETEQISDAELIQNTSKPLTTKLLATIHDDPTNLPPVPPAHTAEPAKKRTLFDNLKLHRIFGCRKFKNQQLIVSASANGCLLSFSKLPATIGDFTTINKPARGKPLTKLRHFLDKVHMDIVYGDCLALSGYRYALLLVDAETR